MAEVERYLWRASCGACRSILWIDRPAPVVCVCSASGIQADGRLQGEAVDDVTDEEHAAFILSDQGRSVTFIELQG